MSTEQSTEITSDGGHLADADLEILAFERQWWKFAGAKETAIRDQFGIGSVRYYQLLNAIIDKPDAAQADPLLVRRLQRLRLARKQQRSTRRLGFEV